METEAKYYTPDVEELRVGFECETLVESFEDCWKKERIYAEFNINGWETNLEDILVGVEDGYLAVRVKYLDSEDIESLGFVHNSTLDREEKISFTKGNYRIDLYKEDKEVRIRKVIMPDFPHKVINLFVGKIKNLSELKQVLKMIGVH